MKKPVISRRKLLKGAAALGLFGCVCGMPGMRVALAAAPTDKRFVLFIARGAADGLALIPPYGDRDYREARGPLALGKDLYIPLDDFFGAHRELSYFAELFRNKEAAVVQAVATTYRERSHFDAQNVLESGLLLPAKVSEGWLNRALGLYGGNNAALGLAFGQTLPLVLQGRLAVPCWAPSEQGLPGQEMLRALETMYADDALFRTALDGAIGVHGMVDNMQPEQIPADSMPAAPVEELKAQMPAEPAMDGMEKDKVSLNPRDFTSGADMKLVPNKLAMQNAMASIGRLLSEDKGPRIATVDQGGWDTHAMQGTASGILPFNASLLNAGLQSLRESLGPTWEKTVVLFATEFGRTVAANGTNGSDHGTAFAVLLAGGAVAGGRVLGDWPGLAKDKQYKGRDLAPTTDLRAIAKGVLRDHLGIGMDDLSTQVFPDSGDVRPLDGLLKTS